MWNTQVQKIKQMDIFIFFDSNRIHDYPFLSQTGRIHRLVMVDSDITKLVHLRDRLSGVSLDMDERNQRLDSQKKKRLFQCFLSRSFHGNFRSFYVWPYRFVPDLGSFSFAV